MTDRRVAPYGSWASPITAEMLAGETIGVSSPVVDGDDLYWAERRPAEAGRTAIVRRSADGTVADVTPPEFNARTRIHEYGGTSYAVRDGVVLASEFAGQRIHRLDRGEAQPVTPEPAIPAGDRYADLVFHGDVVLAVRERHGSVGDLDPVSEIVAFPLDGSETPRVVAGGHDFHASPARHPDGTRLAWLTWDHPRMPWDGTDLWVADLDAGGSLGEPRHVAGGPGESIFQPSWGPDGSLHWASDRSGWWNLYREGEPLAPMEADIGAPQWTFGLSRYAFLDDGRIAAIADADGVQRLVAIGPDGAVDEIGFPHRCIIHYLVMGAGRLWTLGGDAGTPIGLVGVDPDSGDLDVVRRDSDVSLDEAWYSAPEHIVAPTTDGAVTHAFFYPPTNPDFTAPDGTLPPLVVLSHGGPTSATRTSLDLGIQYWTSRGIGVVDVDYRGSTGYGRDYRRALEGRWGIVDTEDCIAAARHLVEKGLADGDRLAIRGGSAGGYTTLCALAFHDVFRVGASYFGVADLAALTEHTHKFESRYLDSMVGPYPETEDVYRARSPVHHADGITCPVLLLQGSEDRIVLPEQAEAMLQPLADRGIPHAYILFEGEGHGFRAAATVIAATEAELWFYGRMLGFEPADDLPEIPLR